LGPEVSARTVTLTSASKSFNLAGMRWAIAHIGSRSVRAAFDALPAHFAGITSIMAAAAVEAAWTHGDEWLEACVRHLDARRYQLQNLLREHLPEVEYRVPAATYLAWLDCRPLGLASEPVEVFRRGGVELSPGPDFSTSAHGFVRLNFATSSSMLESIVARMGAAVGVR
jgi:cystathionine beta-lyase